MGGAATVALRVSSPADPGLAAWLGRGLDEAGGDRPSREPASLSVAAVDPGGETVGGAVGRLAWGWLHVELLWVAPAWRGTGLGSRLLRGMEDAAQGRGCTRAYLSTLAWQAPDFYRRHGYAPFAELPSFAGPHARFWLAKALTDGAPVAPLAHRIRAAALVFRGDGLLLVEHHDPARGVGWWSPPGGGVEGDEPIAECAARETREETGLAVTVGRLAYVQDLLVPEMGRRNAEFFLLCDDPGDALRPAPSPGARTLGVAFVSRGAMGGIRVLPGFLTDVLWQDREAGFPSVRMFRDATVD
jgi:8-oxo-dGTP diphosphatase